MSDTPKRRKPQGYRKQKVPTREEQTKFAADKFRFLRQVALNPEYPPLASRFAILLLPYFNLEYGGKLWAAQDTLAEDFGYHRQTINHWLKLFVKHGDLTYKRGGWGDTNNYYMAIKKVATDVGRHGHQEEATNLTDVGRHGQSDVGRHGQNLILPIQGDSFAVPLGEGDAASAGPAPDGAPTSAGGVGAGVGKDDAVRAGARVPHGQELAALRAVWVRKRHIVADAKPGAVKAQQRALDAALQIVSFDVILVAAKSYAAAYDPENNGRQFLDKLEDWLNARGWELPPPKRGKAKGANGHARGTGHYGRRKGKSAPDAIAERIKQRIRAGGGLQ